MRDLQTYFLKELQKKLKTHPEDDVLVWIQDYQLSLVPLYLRRKLAEAGLERKVKIGYFHHIPFAKPESFRLIPKKSRRTLLEGLLATDRIGFHIREYIENFLDAVRVNIPEARIIPGRVKLGGRTIAVGEHPIGIDPAQWREMAKSRETIMTAKGIRENYSEKGYQTIFSGERLDPIKGVLEKLDGYERLLIDHPELRGKLVLLQAAEASRTGIPEYQILRKNVGTRVKEINRKYQIKGRHLPRVFLVL